MFRKFIAVLLLPLVFLLSSSPAIAADVRSGDSVSISSSEQGLSDLYIFGSSVTIDAPVRDEVVAAGSNVTINGDVTGNINAAGGSVNINSQIDESARVAGGNVTISKPIKKDAFVAGGNILITKSASISGDVYATGGRIVIEAPIEGDLHVNGENVIINSTVGGSVDANVQTLRLGSSAAINGDLNYRSSEEAVLENGASISGRNNFEQIDSKEKAKQGVKSLVTGFAIYMLVANILFGILLLWLLRKFVLRVIGRIDESAVSTGFTGFLAFFAIPLIAFLLLFLIWPGIFIFLVYIVLLMFAGIVSSIYTGYFIMRWFENRNNKKYVLSWVAVVVGSIALFIINLIPIIGWLITTTIFFLSFGGITKELLRIREQQMIEPAKSSVVSKTSSPRSTKRRS